MTEKITESDKERTKFNRANIDPELFKIFQEAQSKLREYKVEVNFTQFSAFIVPFLPTDVGSKFVEKWIPLQHPAIDLMDNPRFRSELERLLQKHENALAKQ